MKTDQLSKRDLEKGLRILGRAHMKKCPMRPFNGWANCRVCLIAEHARSVDAYIPWEPSK